jgi:hypothetical protein
MPNSGRIVKRPDRTCRRAENAPVVEYIAQPIRTYSAINRIVGDIGMPHQAPRDWRGQRQDSARNECIPLDRGENLFRFPDEVSEDEEDEREEEED